ncbi:MAG: type II secretion system protein GspF [Phycisphaerae bacterium]|nr:type II secretion system protein GspF [Phycisphaerae bacterium]NIT59838.1 type II secretion system protein GspF [Fodinibius sp.]NIU11372.1 type II secretion system protein GspF [Phycisphaerae bacterium]NIU59149.1 type II secretion system protein GspF [Phycisphaerae bacterium]NIV14568.1 type II secretion system protein GspF [Fodinibius sp.]
MSVVEYKLSSDKKAVQPYQTSESNGSSDAQQKTYERDIFNRVRTKDVCSIVRQLATLLRAGMPLVQALSALVEQLRGIRGRENPLADIMEQVADNVNSGSTLADALGKHPNVFSNMFVNMVAAGETSGTLEEVLLRMAEILEKRLHLAAKVKSAVAYPLMMIVVAVAVVVFLMSVVIPSITEIFIEMNRSLPWPTRFLIATSTFMKTYLKIILPVLIVALLGLRAAYRTKEGKEIADRWKLKLPLFGRLLLKAEIARLTRTLGILLISGIPILNALEIAKQVIQNRVIANAMDSVKDLVGKGEAIANAIRKTGLFPPIVYHIIATGQISGNVEDGLINIADMYDDEVELTTKTLTSLLEPVILLIMGAIVGFIVLAVLLPIFDINQVL